MNKNWLFAELWSDAENQVVLRANGRFAARLSPAKLDTADHDASAAPQTKATPEQAYAVDIKTPGIFSKSHVATRKSPSPGTGTSRNQNSGRRFKLY